MWARTDVQNFLPQVVEAFNREPRDADRGAVHPARRTGAEVRNRRRGRHGAGHPVAGPDLYAGLRGGRTVDGPDGPGAQALPTTTSFRPRIFRRAPMTAGFMGCRSRRTRPSCCGTRTCTRRRGSTRKTGRRTGKRSSRRQPPCGRWACGHLWLLLLGRLRRVQRLHLPALYLGAGVGHRVRGWHPGQHRHAQVRPQSTSIVSFWPPMPFRPRPRPTPARPSSRLCGRQHRHRHFGRLRHRHPEQPVCRHELWRDLHSGA